MVSTINYEKYEEINESMDVLHMAFLVVNATIIGGSWRPQYFGFIVSHEFSNT